MATLCVENQLKTSSLSKAKALNNSTQSLLGKIIIFHQSAFLNILIWPKLISQHKELLHELKPGESAGPDNIPTWILKEYAFRIAPVLQVIYTKQIYYQKTGLLPVYKKDDKSNPANYRPISLTSVCCKTMEHIICHSILDHLNIFNIISSTESTHHGFRSGLSCQTQLILLVDEQFLEQWTITTKLI